MRRRSASRENAPVVQRRALEQHLSDTAGDGRPRSLFLADLRSLERWADVAGDLTSHDSGGFALLLATAEPADYLTVEAIARWSIPLGIFSAAFWGPQCEVAHDTFDEMDVILHIDAGVAPEDQSFVMTTWHADETLDETLDFFWDLAIVSEGKVYGPRRIVLAVSPDGQLAEQVRHWAEGR